MHATAGRSIGCDAMTLPASPCPGLGDMPAGEPADVLMAHTDTGPAGAAAAGVTARACMQATGDTWNYVNNAQARLGVSATFNTLLVWPAAAAAVALYFQVPPPPRPHPCHVHTVHRHSLTLHCHVLKVLSDALRHHCHVLTVHTTTPTP